MGTPQLSQPCVAVVMSFLLWVCGQVLQDRPRGTGQLGARAVPAMKGQVDGPEKLREPFGLRLFVGHGTRVALGNPSSIPMGSRR